MGFISDNIFGLVIQKPNKTGLMNIVHISSGVGCTTAVLELFCRYCY